MNEDAIKQSFQKAKEDIFYLSQELADLKFEIAGLKDDFRLISSFINDLKLSEIAQNDSFLHSNKPTDTPTVSQTPILPQNIPVTSQIPAIQHINPTIQCTPTDTPTVPQEIKGLIAPKTGISTGNGGVPTDTPTDKPTNQQTIQHIPLPSINSRSVSLDNAQELLESLDNLKKEVRIKFKRLTPQEIQVFSLLYNLEEQGFIVDCKLLADNLKLSESSVRDYVGKIQKKGIPISKEKVNNKRVLLHISPELKKIASLQTILKLREI